MAMNNIFVVVPWVTEKEKYDFLTEWGLNSIPDWLILQQDKQHDGCGVTKNKGVASAVSAGAEIVVVLDGDCYPYDNIDTLDELIHHHKLALEPQPVNLYKDVTKPASRGTPYYEKHVTMPVAASMGFWVEVGDYCAVRQLAFNNAEMTYNRNPVYGKYFSLCGMNIAFRPQEWQPWCNFIDVPRFDDIWMGWLWQREAYRRGYCFNLNGPTIRHARQSNIWKNLRDETKYLQQSETLWRKIALHPANDYSSLRGLLPV
jgi:hypothetical protein